MMLKLARMYKLVASVISILGAVLAVNNTHTLYMSKASIRERGEVIYPKHRIINQSQIEFVSNKALKK
ncbi:MAG: hypothetical protein ACRC5T_04630 [Cetobacterium sp.]